MEDGIEVSKENEGLQESLDESHAMAIDQMERRKAAESLLAEDVAPVVIPDYASWFQIGEIHEIERQALPEFFEEGPPEGPAPIKTDQVYLAYKKFMVDSYRRNPTELLTGTFCRKHLRGDVCSILRVHAFLEKWGLINYQVDASRRPRIVVPRDTKHHPLFGNALDGLRPSLTHLSIDRKEPQLSMHANLFSTGAIELGVKGGSPGWTEDETLRLLEALEKYGDKNWSAVAQHVKTKTKEECVLHFLRLPIEDPFLEEQLPSATAPTQCEGETEFLPFADAANPVMALIAFLTSMVDPEVASAAAESIRKMKEEKPNFSEWNIPDLCAASVAAAQDRAKSMVEVEERKLQKLSARLQELQLQKLILKYQSFDRLERQVRQDMDRLERHRQQLLIHKLRLTRDSLGAEVTPDALESFVVEKIQAPHDLPTSATETPETNALSGVVRVDGDDDAKGAAIERTDGVPSSAADSMSMDVDRGDQPTKPGEQ
eukprot:TRINITY_DN759_c5_g1_i1.p1 TRINITY_DN759_c5_g1~~TRINITY_DN759_c5_g1_i1.p1  ORF type:complete len:535 (-),score=187.90 TRINITY_DN759_c5_g1_i1:95-1558(-)